MERRSFLKAIAALAATPIIEVPDFRLIEPEGLILPGERWFSTVREMCAFDLRSDSYLFRWELTNGAKQWSVDAMVDSRRALEQSREAASIMLRDTLRAERIPFASLRPLPIPLGWKNAVPEFA